MCILFIAVQQHKEFPLIIAANRDEFFQRPTEASHFWPQEGILAGKDLTAGGSWMGISREGRIAALTNIREPDKQDPQAKSRGKLVTDYLTGEQSIDAYHHQLSSTADDFNGYNLLYGTWQNLQVYNNRSNKLEPLKKGVYGLSNASLNSPWPKLNRGVQALTEYCCHEGPVHSNALFELLKDETQAQDDMLPQTGIPLDRERLLSSIFINTPDYGTRSSTLLKVDNHGQVRWREQSFDNQMNLITEKSYQLSFS